MEEQNNTLQNFIDNYNVKNSLGYFIKISGVKYKGSFFSQTSKYFTFIVESLKEIPNKYSYYIVTDIDIIAPTKQEIKSLKSFYQNVSKIPCLLEIKIEIKED